MYRGKLYQVTYPCSPLKLRGLGSTTSPEIIKYMQPITIRISDVQMLIHQKEEAIYKEMVYDEKESSRLAIPSSSANVASFFDLSMLPSAG